MLLYDSKSGDQNFFRRKRIQNNETKHVYKTKKYTKRGNFTSSGSNVFLEHFQTLTQSERGHILNNSQGKEMAKLLKAISPNCCIPKAIPKCSWHLLEKEKQRKILLETITGGLICPKIPDEVRI